MSYLVKTPEALKSIAKDLIWNFNRSNKDIYLTFDDGPTPEVTDQVLDLLAQYNAKATFFCIGGNVSKEPRLYEKILIGGHSTGNHTWNHMSGWEYSDFSYYRNVLECSSQVKSDLFRPPYGRIKPSQAKGLLKNYRIVMWDVLSGDWDQNLSPSQCLKNVLKHTKSGSIVVFHDSIKARKNMLFALEESLKHFSDLGFTFRAIPRVIDGV